MKRIIILLCSLMLCSISVGGQSEEGKYYFLFRSLHFVFMSAAIFNSKRVHNVSCYFKRNKQSNL